MVRDESGTRLWMWGGFWREGKLNYSIYVILYLNAVFLLIFTPFSTSKQLQGYHAVDGWDGL
jgi:hypothetical protein